jgi:hypothetical protein
MIQEAKQLGLKTMVGCMTESGISAIPLITAIGLRRYGRALLLAEDIATGITLEYGKLSILNTMGPA